MYVEKKSSILSELEYFIYDDGRIDAVDSHRMFLKLMEENKVLKDSGV